MGKKVKPTKHSKCSKNPRGSYQSVDDGEDQPVISNRHHQRQKHKKFQFGSVNVDQETRLRNSLALDGLEIVEMSPDGNCLFRSLSDQLFGDYGNMHSDVRSAVCDYMEKHQDDFKVFLVFQDKDDEDQQEEDARDFDHYIETVRKDGEWGGNLEIVAAARLYQRKITVFSTTLAALTIDHGESKPLGPDLLVSYHDNDHYNSVRDRKSPPKPVKNHEGAKWKSCDDDNDDDDEIYPAVHNKISDDGIPKRQQKDPEGTRMDDPANDTFIEDATKSVSRLSLKEKKSKLDKAVKKSAPCPCGSGLKYKKCCLAQQKQVVKSKRLHGPDQLDLDGAKDVEPVLEETLKSRGQFQVVSI